MKLLNTSKSLVPNPLQTSAQKVLRGMSPKPIAPALSHQERELHRHAGCGGVSRQQKKRHSLVLTMIYRLWNRCLSLQIPTYLLKQVKSCSSSINTPCMNVFDTSDYETMNRFGCRKPRLVATRIQLTLAQEAHLASSLQRFEELGFKLEKQGEGEWDVTQAPRLWMVMNLNRFCLIYFKIFPKKGLFGDD